MTTIFDCLKPAQKQTVATELAKHGRMDFVGPQDIEGLYRGAMLNLSKPNLRLETVTRLQIVVAKAAERHPAVRADLQRQVEKRRYNAMLSREIARHANQ